MSYVYAQGVRGIRNERLLARAVQCSVQAPTDMFT